MNCVLYARVSMGAQADRQLSIPARLSAMREFASRQGWAVLGEFLDAGISARTADRAELRRLVERCRNGEQRIDAVLVHKVDRLAQRR